MKFNKFFITLVLIVVSTAGLYARVGTTTLNLRGTAVDDIYNIQCCFGFYTVFEIPAGETVTETILSKLDRFKIDRYGPFVWIKPIVNDDKKEFAASFSVITKSKSGEKIYVFILKASTYKDYFSPKVYINRKEK